MPDRNTTPQPALGGAPLLGVAAALTAVLAVIGCVVMVVLDLPTAVEIAVVCLSVVLLAAAGAMIGISVARSRAQQR